MTSGNIVQHRYNEIQIPQRSQDGYVSLTAMAKANGKNVNDYLRLKGTVRYVKALSSHAEIPVTELIQVLQGGDSEEKGTWSHPEIAIDFAQWVNVEFRIWANRTLRGKVQLAYAAPALKSPEENIAIWTDAFKTLGLTDSPRHLQLVRDRVATILGEGQKVLPASKPALMGVTEVAESLGYNPYQVRKVCSGLGRVVAAWYRSESGNDPQTEERIVNGRMCKLKVYLRTEELDQMVSAYLQAKNVEVAA